MTVERDPLFGHRRLLERVLARLHSTQPVRIGVVGARLTGKSTVVRYLQTHLRQRYSSQEIGEVVLVDCALLSESGEFWRYLQRETPQSTRPPAEDSGEPFLSWLEQFSATSNSAVLLLDNFDQLLLRTPHPANLCDQLYQLSRTIPLIVTAQQPLHDVQPTLASSPLISDTVHLFLGLLEAAAAAEWLTYTLGPIANQAVLASLLELTGRHPFLLQIVGDCFAELQTWLPPEQALDQFQLPLLCLRLAEHGRPLFLAQAALLQNPPATLDTPALQQVLHQLGDNNFRLTTLAPELLPALNWLINQALIGYAAGETGPVYTFYSPLFVHFWSQYSANRAPHPAPLAPSAEPRTLSANGDAIYDQLTKIEAALLRYFQQHSTMVISTEELLTAVWKRPQASSRRVQEAIRRLRIQLEQHQSPIGEIHNERGRGYRFIPAPTV